MTETTDEPSVEEKRRTAKREMADGLHKLAKATEREAEFYRTAANQIITGRWDIREFIEEAETRDVELVDELPEIPTDEEPCENGGGQP